MLTCPPRHGPATAMAIVPISEGRMIRLETLIEFIVFNSSFSSSIYQFELSSLLNILLKLIKQFSVEQFEATASQSTVSSPPSYHSSTRLRSCTGTATSGKAQNDIYIYIYIYQAQVWLIYIYIYIYYISLYYIIHYINTYGFLLR